MDIGSAKPSKEELKSAKHHLVDFVDPAEKFSVAEYQKVARKAIKEIINNLWHLALVFYVEMKESRAMPRISRCWKKQVLWKREP